MVDSRACGKADTTKRRSQPRELCWNPQPGEGIRAKTVLLCLDGTLSQPPSPNVDGEAATDVSSDATANDS